MAETNQEFRLSLEEFDYMKDLLSDKALQEFLPRLQESTPGERSSIRLNRAEAERIREYLTGQLAADGFDEDYRPTKKGQMIEELIDRFYVP